MGYSPVRLQRRQVAMDLGPFPTVTQGNISDEVYRILRERILNSHSAPGERLQLAEIQSQMGISRTPLQHALNRLAVEGLVQIVPRKGTFVTRPARQDIEEAFELRSILEAYAAEMAAQSMTAAECDALCALADKMAQLAQAEGGPQARRTYDHLDQQFHQLIVDASGGKHLKKLWTQVNAHVRIARTRVRLFGELGLRTTEHAEIAHAFAARDGARARKLLEEHIRRAKTSLLSGLEALDHPNHAA
jgi:DNA-binding GntR family transcriptional regulator